MNVHGPPVKLLNFDLNADPDPAFNSNADPDAVSKNNMDQCGSATLAVSADSFIYFTLPRRWLVVCVPVWKNDSAGRRVWLKSSLSPLTRASVDPVT